MRSALLLFSTILSVSEESDAVIVSPVTNVPVTDVNTTLVAEVPVAKTNPVAPDVEPFTCIPPLEKLDVRVGLGVPLKVSVVNSFTSNKNNL